MANTETYRITARLPFSSYRSEFTRVFMDKFQQGMKALAAMPRKNEGLAVLTAANLNFMGLPIQPGTFDGVNLDADALEKLRHNALIQECKNRLLTGSEIPSPVYRKIGLFEGQFNELRGFKPQGMATRTELEIDTPFNPNGFHYGKVNDEEVFLHNLTVNGIKAELLFNLFPYAPFHFLMVPERGRGINQSLENFELFRLAWDFMQTSAEPNLRLAFNSLGAYASQNNLHFQGFFIDENWAPPFDHVLDQSPSGSGINAWPIAFRTYHNVTPDILREIHAFLMEIHAAAKSRKNEVAYNLYLRPTDITVFPRKHQALCADYINSSQADFTTGPAWIEILGTYIMPRKDAFYSADEAEIESLGKFLSLPELV